MTTKLYFNKDIIEKFNVQNIKFASSKDDQHYFMIYNYDPKKFKKGIKLNKNMDVLSIDFDAVANVKFIFDSKIDFAIERLTFLNYHGYNDELIQKFNKYSSIKKINIKKSSGTITDILCKSKAVFKDCNDLTIDKIVIQNGTYYCDDCTGITVKEEVHCHDKRISELSISAKSDYITDDYELEQIIKKTKYL